jgi:hypothetical protein
VSALQLDGCQLSVPGVLWDEHQVPVGRITDIDSVVPLKVTVGADASPRQFGVQIVSPLPADRRKGQAGAALCVAGEGLEDHHFQTPLGKVGRRSWRRQMPAPITATSNCVVFMGGISRGRCLPVFAARPDDRKVLRC